MKQMLARAFGLVTGLALGLLLVVVGTFVANTVYFYPRLKTASQTLIAVQQAHEGMIDQETGVRGFLLSTPDTATQFLAPYHAGRQETAANLNQASQLLGGDATVAPLLRDMSRHATAWREDWAEPAIANRALAASPAFLARGKTLFDAYRSVESNIIGVLGARLSRTLTQQRNLLATGLALAALITLAMVAVVLRQRRQLMLAVASPVADLAQIVHRIRDGDLRATPETGGRRVAAEIAGLGDDVRDMGESLAGREAELHRNQRILTEAQELAALGSWEHDVDTDSTKWTPELLKIWDADPDEGPPELDEVLARVHEADRDRFAAATEQVVTTGTNAQISYRIRRRDGEIRYIESRFESEHDHSGRLVRMTGTSQDVTERAHDQRALAESERRYRLLAQHSTDLISRHDPEGTFLYVSGAARTLLGREPEELTGTSAFPLVHPDDLGPVERLQREMAAGADTGRVSFRMRHANGSWVWVEAISSAVRDPEGQLEEIQVTTRDVTQARRVEEERRAATAATAEARDAAVQATAAKSGFLAAMSHEIRTPMNAIVGMSDLLLETDVDPEQRQFSETIRTSADVLLSIINNVLDFSKIESGALELERAPFDLRDCVEGVAGLLGQAATAKGIDLVSHVDNACPDHILGDVTRLRQVLLNLLTNAIKFTTTGDVLVSVRPTDHSGDAGNPGDEVRLEFAVTDTGVGIPDAAMDRLFESFSQVDASTTRTHGGTGLGLAISQRLVRAMGGTIRVTSEEGAGSTFSFTLPFEPYSAPSHAAPSNSARSDSVPADSPRSGSAPADSASSDRPRGLRILVVEDNPTNQKVVQLMLNKLGYAADEVANGQQAVDAVRDRHYDVVLMDVQMPEMDGLAATRAIRAAEDPSEHVYVVGLSAGAFTEDRDAGVGAGMDAFLAKPVRKQELGEALDAAQVRFEHPPVGRPRPGHSDGDPDDRPAGGDQGPAAAADGDRAG